VTCENRGVTIPLATASTSASGSGEFTLHRECGWASVAIGFSFVAIAPDDRRRFAAELDAALAATPVRS
jgi:hypothetical protein